MTDPTKPAPEAAKTQPAPKADPAPAVDPGEFAVLLQQHGEIPAGRIVRGKSSEIRALGSGVARPATKEDFGIAGGKSVRLPRK